MAMHIDQPKTIEVTTFTPDETRMLEDLRLHFRGDRDLFENHHLFSARERAYLRFLHWLVRLGRLVP